MVGVDFFHAFRMKNRFIRKVTFSRLFRTPDGIMCRVTGVWVIPLLTYFNFCPFFLNTPNYKSPSGEQIIFISRRENSLFATIRILSFFIEGGKGLSRLSISLH